MDMNMHNSCTVEMQGFSFFTSFTIQEMLEGQ